LSEDQFIQHLVAAITETEYALIPHGLHIAGRGMDTSERSEMLAKMALSVETDSGFVADPELCQGHCQSRSRCPGCGNHRTLDEEAKSVVQKLVQIDQDLSDNRELDGLVQALDARFVPPAPSGDLLRTPDLLPTGRNIHGFDPFGIPSKFALEDGARQAALILDGTWRPMANCRNRCNRAVGHGQSENRRCAAGAGHGADGRAATA
jgi:magnesium chelatase subunit H